MRSGMPNEKDRKQLSLLPVFLPPRMLLSGDSPFMLPGPARRYT